MSSPGGVNRADKHNYEVHPTHTYEVHATHTNHQPKSVESSPNVVSSHNNDETTENLANEILHNDPFQPVQKPLPSKAIHFNIQENRGNPQSTSQNHLNNINVLMRNPNHDPIFQAKLQYEIDKYEASLEGWSWIHHVALSIFGSESSAALKAIKYNSTIDKSSSNFKALLNSLHYPGSSNVVKNLVCSIQDVNGTYSGRVVNGLPEETAGSCSIQYTDGRRFGGQIEAGVLINGAMSWTNKTTYSGPFQNGKPHGKGQMRMAHNSVYEGDFKNGKFEGTGKLTFKDGVYEGEFKQGKFNHGKLTLSNDVVYEGDFKNGKFEGKGRLIQKDGMDYEGNFKNGKFEGEGKLKKNGNVIEGTFENGELAFGEIDYSNGDVYKGPFKDGKFDTESILGTKGVFKRKGGDVYTGRFSQGRFITGTIQSKDKIYRGSLDKDGNFYGTVSINQGMPKTIRIGDKVNFQESFKLDKTTISETTIRKANEMLRNI